MKIDRAFIMNMVSNADDLSIVSTIISLAHSLKMRVVAEGVETEEQARLLRVLKCDEIQGFLFSPGCLRNRLSSSCASGNCCRAECVRRHDACRRAASACILAGPAKILLRRR